MASKIPSGTWVVIILVAIGLLGVGGSWLRYHEENPTSRAALLIPDSDPAGGWRVGGTFAAKDAPRIIPGTLAIVTSAEFPDWKMSGVVEEAFPDGKFSLRVTSAPPPSAERKRVACVVTIDAATIPVSR